MNGREAYEIWAPEGVVWSDWVRPVPFIFMDEGILTSDLKIPKINYTAEGLLPSRCALILDLPGNDAVEEGLALARIGFRPVPLYNGSPEQHGATALVDNKVIESALYFGADELMKITIPANAPPAFLLDSNRVNTYKPDVSVYDNSWDIYPQDMPSADFFLRHGIKNLLVRSDKIRKDLQAVLHRYQGKNPLSPVIKIWLSDGFGELKEMKIKKPRK